MISVDLTKYKTLVFDCDGVVLNSNRIKTQAFYDVALPFGEDKALELVDYHVKNGGISRYFKFRYFIKTILEQAITHSLLEALLEQFSLNVKMALMVCDITAGLQKLKESTSFTNWLIVSGGDQEELREVFIERGLFELFDGGIFGSPDTKDTILRREKACLNIGQPALFLGDSKYDFEAADRADMDFVFVTGWTEVSDWALFQKKHGFPVISAVKTLL